MRNTIVGQNGDSRRRDDDALDRVDLERRVDDVLGAEQSWINHLSLSIDARHFERRCRMEHIVDTFNAGWSSDGVSECVALAHSSIHSFIHLHGSNGIEWNR